MKRVGIIGAFVLFAVGCAHVAPLPPKAIELNRDAAAALAAGDLTTAEARVSLALEYNPKFTEAWVNYGLIQLKRGNFEMAKADLEHAEDLNSDVPTPHHGLGMLAELQGRTADAEKHYRNALKVNPGFAPARVNLGRSLFKRGEYDFAREEFYKLTEVAPESIEGWVGLCESLLKLGRDAEANDQLQLARRRFGDTSPLLVLRARLLVNDDKFAEAESLLAVATQDADAGQAANALAWLAVARIGQGDTSGALVAAAAAKRIDPENTVAQYAIVQATKLATQ